MVPPQWIVVIQLIDEEISMWNEPKITFYEEKDVAEEAEGSVRSWMEIPMNELVGATSKKDLPYS